MQTQRHRRGAGRVFRITLRSLCAAAVVTYFALWVFLVTTSPPGMPGESGLAYLLLHMVAAPVFAFATLSFVAMLVTALVRRVRHPGIGWDVGCLAGSVAGLAASGWILTSWAR